MRAQRLVIPITGAESWTVVDDDLAPVPPIEIVSRILTHRSVATTGETYLHLSVEDVRAELLRVGVWQNPGGRR